MMKWIITFALLNLLALLVLIPVRWMADRTVAVHMAANGIRPLEETKLLTYDTLDQFTQRFPDVNPRDRAQLVEFLSGHKRVYEQMIVNPIAILLLLNAIVFGIIATLMQRKRANKSLKATSQ